VFRADSDTDSDANSNADPDADPDANANANTNTNASTSTDSNPVASDDPAHRKLYGLGPRTDALVDYSRHYGLEESNRSRRNPK
jgi:hypothetical protein